MSAATPAPALRVSWSQSEPTPVIAPPPEWTFSTVHQGKWIALRVGHSYDKWTWSATVGDLSVFGYAPDAESAKQDAHAVVELYLSGRPLFLDRRPTLSVSSPTDLQPAPAVQP